MANKLTITAILDTTGIKSGIKKMNSMLASGCKAAVATIGTVTAGLTAAGVASVKSGEAFTSSFAKASTLFGDVDVNVSKLQGDILALSNNSGLAADAINEGLYAALSASVPLTEDATEAVNYLDRANKLAVAGFTDVETAITATAKTINAYGLGMEDVNKIQNILIQTQNKGITTVDELGKVLSNVTPTAATYGVAFDQVGAAMAVMTARGVPAATAATQLNALFIELGDNSSEAGKAIKAMTSEMETYSAEEIAATKKSQEALYNATAEGYNKQENELRKSLDKQEKELDKSFNSQIETVKSGYATELDALKANSDKTITEVKKQYSDRLATVKSNNEAEIAEVKRNQSDVLNALKDKQADYVDVVKSKQEEALNAVKKSQSEEVKAFTEAYNSKLKLINSEYTEKLKLYDEAKYKAVKAIEDEINALEQKTEAENEAVKKKQQAERIAELEARVLSSSGEERVKAEKELTDYKTSLALEAVQKERADYIALLQDKKKGVEDEYNSKVDKLKQEQSEAIAAEKNKYDDDLTLLKEQQAKELDLYKANQDKKLKLIQEQQNAEYEAVVANNKVELELIVARQEKEVAAIEEQQKNELEAISTVYDANVAAINSRKEEELNALNERKEAELEALQEVNDVKLSNLTNANNLALEALKQQQAEAIANMSAPATDGKTFTELMEEGYTFSEVLDMLREYADNSGVSFDSLFASVDALKAAWTTSGDASAIFAEDLAAMNTEIDMVSEGYAEMADTLEYKTDRIKTNVQNLGTTFFLTYLEEPLKGAADNAQKYIDKITEILQPKETTEEPDLSKMTEQLVGVATEILTDVSTKLIAKAPEMIQVVVGIIQKLAEGIVENAPIIIKAITGVLDVLLNSLPELISTLLNGISTTLTESLPDLITIVVDFIVEMLEQLPTYLDIILKLVIKVITLLIQGIADNADKLIDTLLDVISEIIDVVLDFIVSDEFLTFIKVLLNAMIVIITTVAEKMYTMLPEFLEVITKLVTTLIEFVIKVLPIALEAVLNFILEWLTNFPEWIRQTFDFEKIKALILERAEDLKAAVGDMLSKAMSVLSEKKDEFIQRGKDLIGGLIDGVKDKFNAVKDTFAEIGENLSNGMREGFERKKQQFLDTVSNITDGAKDLFGIHSPSKVWEKEVGHYLAEGMVVGFDKDNPIGQISKSMQAGMSNLQSSLNITTEGVNRGDYNQVININSRAQSPDEIARAIRIQSKYGLAGAY